MVGELVVSDSCDPEDHSLLGSSVPGISQACILELGKIEGRRRRGQQRMRWLDSTTNSTDMNLSKLREVVEDRGAWWATVHEVTKGQMGHSD